MTSKPNLSQMLAFAGGAVTLAAVTLGFLAVGGPGDARERRLDDITMNRIGDTLSLAQCALNASGAVPASLEDAYKARPAPTPQMPAPPTCGGELSARPPASNGDTPTRPGDVVYEAINATQVRICASFRRPFARQNGQPGPYPLEGVYPQLGQARPAGRYCYTIELIKGG